MLVYEIFMVHGMKLIESDQARFPAKIPWKKWQKCTNLVKKNCSAKCPAFFIEKCVSWKHQVLELWDCKDQIKKKRDTKNSRAIFFYIHFVVSNYYILSLDLVWSKLIVAKFQKIIYGGFGSII